MVNLRLVIPLLPVTQTVYASIDSQPQDTRQNSPENPVWDGPVQRHAPWVPVSYRDHTHWVVGIAEEVGQSPKELHPYLKELQDFIETDPRAFMLFESMFDEGLQGSSVGTDPNGNPRLENYQQMLQVINHVLTTPPSWDDRVYRTGFVGLPFTAMMAQPRLTPAGIAAFMDPKVNRIIKKVLGAWGEFLSSSESAVVLGNCSSCWFSTTALQAMTAVANVGVTAYTWDEIYESDSNALYHGYQSWDAFFTRPFRDGIRPVDSPDNDRIIVHACEAQPFNIQQGVRARDHFWVKGQPYSVRDLLGQDALADRFIGGTVYQGFLSSLNYHRWHAPVAGRILKAYNIPGTYFSQAPFTADPTLGNYTDYLDFSYSPTMATRAVIIIEADHPAIGLVAFVGAGMAEVSTCEITVTAGQQVQKGEELGMFHYGGSTHCLLFEDRVHLSGWPRMGDSVNLPVRSQLAVVE
ncbi:hypothetical protein BBP40_005810 [Aspergillus hancockii]|nr:hypothetical protein BBP40_005810 [Aspergillus hancockii]